MFVVGFVWDVWVLDVFFYVGGFGFVIFVGGVVSVMVVDGLVNVLLLVIKGVEVMGVVDCFSIC